MTSLTGGVRYSRLGTAALCACAPLMSLVMGPPSSGSMSWPGVPTSHPNVNDVALGVQVYRASNLAVSTLHHEQLHRSKRIGCWRDDQSPCASSGGNGDWTLTLRCGYIGPTLDSSN